MTRIIRICMLNADVPVPKVFAERAPTYGRIFHDLLAQASSQVKIESEDFDVQNLEYPDSIDDFDAIIISGSANSAYDDIPWVHQLDDYVRDVYVNHPKVKIFGSCFGHQLMCQSLLKDYGVKVEADPNGWEIGVKEITLHQHFRETFAKTSGSDSLLNKKLRLQFVHHDHVVIHEQQSLPRDWTIFGSTEHCAVQGVYQPGRILTFQGHFEFDRFVNTETINVFFSTWDTKVLQAALDDIDANDDAVTAAQLVLQFFEKSTLVEDDTSNVGADFGVEISAGNTSLKPISVAA